MSGGRAGTRGQIWYAVVAHARGHGDDYGFGFGLETVEKPEETTAEIEEETGAYFVAVILHSYI